MAAAGTCTHKRLRHFSLLSSTRRSVDRARVSRDLGRGPSDGMEPRRIVGRRAGSWLLIDRDIQVQAGMTRDSFAPASDNTAGDNHRSSPAPHKGRSRPITLLIVGAVVLIAAIACGTAAMIVNLRNRVLTDNERELRNLALVVAAQADRIFDGAERVESSLVQQFAELGVATSDDFERKMSGYRAHLLLKDKIVGLPHVGTFTLVNAQGKVFNFSRSWPIPPIDVTDRDFFNALRQDGGPASYVSKPIQNRATGTWVVHLARKVAGPNGEFIGLVTAAIE